MTVPGATVELGGHTNGQSSHVMRGLIMLLHNSYGPSCHMSYRRWKKNFFLAKSYLHRCGSSAICLELNGSHFDFSGPILNLCKPRWTSEAISILVDSHKQQQTRVITHCLLDVFTFSNCLYDIFTIVYREVKKRFSTETSK